MREQGCLKNPSDSVLGVFYFLIGGVVRVARTGTRKAVGARERSRVSRWLDLPRLCLPAPRWCSQGPMGQGVSLPGCLEERRGGRCT